MRNPELVVLGDVVLAATPTGLERAEAVGIRGGRVIAAGGRHEVLATAGPGTRIVDAGPAAVLPGLHDFHLHLAELARSRATVRLDDAADAAEIGERLRARAASLPPDGWLVGRGWTETQLRRRGGVAALVDAVGALPVFLDSHDGHSAWASPEALRRAGVGPETPDPAGGRIERDDAGVPTGVLRETALELVGRLVPQLRGPTLEPHLRDALADLAALGITGATEAGDYTDEGGGGSDAAFGDSFSALTELGALVDGRLRLTIDIPADALEAAAARGLRTGAPLGAWRTLRFGWVKAFADGALGSGTAALFEPSLCGDGGTGILRLTPEALDEIVGGGRRAGIGLAIHAIGDRAAATVLDALERAAPRTPGVPADRMEHLQLVRPDDRRRLAALGVTASIQPIHAASDRELVEACWGDRMADAYPWRALADAGALLAAGSDAPIESVNPWLGIVAAVHRRHPDDARGDWTTEAALTGAEALAAYTSGPALAIGATDEGHLRSGARADLAVLDRPLDALLAADEGLAGARSVLTVVDGEVVHEA